MKDEVIILEDIKMYSVEADKKKKKGKKSIKHFLKSHTLVSFSTVNDDLSVCVRYVHLITSLMFTRLLCYPGRNTTDYTYLNLCLLKL